MQVRIEPEELLLVGIRGQRELSRLVVDDDEFIAERRAATKIPTQRIRLDQDPNVNQFIDYVRVDPRDLPLLAHGFGEYAERNESQQRFANRDGGDIMLPRERELRE